MAEGCAFVAGATGLTGRAVVAALRAREVPTIAHIRPTSSSRARWEKDFEALGAEVDTTPWNEEAMRESIVALAPRFVFALLGTTRARARAKARSGGDPSDESYEAVDYGLSALLRRASEASPSAPRFIYLSSMGVTPGTPSPYLAARAKVEAELEAGALPYVIARPSFILGDRDEARPAESIGASIADGALTALGWLGGGRVRDRYQSMNAEQLAEALVSLALDPNVTREIVEADGLRRRAG